MGRCVVAGCDGDIHGHEMCDKHYRRWLKHGDPLVARLLSFKLKWLHEAASAETDECVVWPFIPASNGYGKVHLNYDDVPAHFIILDLRNMDRPAGGEQTRHLCGNPLCLNYRHLLVGTASENQNDRWEHGTMLHGESSPNAKLTWAHVDCIREACSSGTTIADLARLFGVSESNIRAIVQFKTWKPENRHR